MLLKLTSNDLSKVSILNSPELIELTVIKIDKIQSPVIKIKNDYGIIYG